MTNVNVAGALVRGPIRPAAKTAASGLSAGQAHALARLDDDPAIFSHPTAGAGSCMCADFGSTTPLIFSFLTRVSTLEAVYMPVSHSVGLAAPAQPVDFSVQMVNHKLLKRLGFASQSLAEGSGFPTSITISGDTRPTYRRDGPNQEEQQRMMDFLKSGLSGPESAVASLPDAVQQAAVDQVDAQEPESAGEPASAYELPEDAYGDPMVSDEPLDDVADECDGAPAAEQNAADYGGAAGDQLDGDAAPDWGGDDPFPGHGGDDDDASSGDDRASDADDLDADQDVDADAYDVAVEWEVPVDEANDDSGELAGSQAHNSILLSLIETVAGMSKPLLAVALPILTAIGAIGFFNYVRVVVLFTLVVALQWLTRFQVTIRTTQFVLSILSYVFGRFGVPFPNTLNKALLFLGVAKPLDKLMKQRYVFCPHCKSLYELDKCVLRQPGQPARSKVCTARSFGTPCGTTLLQSKFNKRGQLVLFPDRQQKIVLPGIAPQLERILKRPTVREAFHHHIGRAREVPAGILADIWDGEVMKTWRQTQAPHGRNWFSHPWFDVALILFGDGFKPWKRGQYSIFALYAVLANLPRSIRFDEENMLLLCLFPGMFRDCERVRVLAAQL